MDYFVKHISVGVMQSFLSAYSASKSFMPRREAAGSADACPNASSDALGGQGEATTAGMI
jgi:hypothetical protein